MRIDGGQTTGFVTRSLRMGGAVTPFRETSATGDARPHHATPVAGQSLSAAPQGQGVQSDAAPSQYTHYVQPGLSMRAVQALSSYSMTASYTEFSSAQYVLGIDLYA